MSLFATLGFAALLVLAALWIVEGLVTRAIAAYDRRTDAVLQARLAGINQERDLFFQWLRHQWQLHQAKRDRG